jgi:cytochrome P450
VAGTDTTAHTLSLAVGELALNPQVFDKAQALVDEVFQSQDTLTLASLKHLGYLQGIVKETLRLYSVASGTTSMQATRAMVVDDIHVPAGTKLFWSMLGAGRDPSAYPQPQVFMPERWLGKDHPAPPMIDFGSGPHRCLGEHLAMLESTLMLAQLLRHFSWELVNGRSSLENLKQNLLIYPVDGMPIYVHPRT